MFKTTIIIPALNPPKILVELVKELIDNDQKVIVVNDGSTKNHNDIFDAVAKSGAKVLNHPINRGVGAAIKTGMAYVLQNHIKAIGVITADADGQHDVKDIVRISKMLQNEPTSTILGTRHINFFMMPLRNFIGNVLARIIFRTFTGKKILDTQCGLRAIPIAFVPELVKLNGQGFEYLTQMLLYLTRSGTKIVQEPIKTIYSKKIGSHFRPIDDSLTIIKIMMQHP